MPQSRHFIAAYLAVIVATVWLAHGRELDVALVVTPLLLVGALLAHAIEERSGGFEDESFDRYPVPEASKIPRVRAEMEIVAFDLTERVSP